MMRRVAAFAWRDGVGGACCAASPKVKSAAIATAPEIRMVTCMRRRLLWRKRRNHSILMVNCLYAAAARVPRPGLPRKRRGPAGPHPRGIPRAAAAIQGAEDPGHRRL